MAGAVERHRTQYAARAHARSQFASLLACGNGWKDCGGGLLRRSRAAATAKALATAARIVSPMGGCEDHNEPEMETNDGEDWAVPESMD